MKGETVIPGDDIMERYLASSLDVRKVVSSILLREGGPSIVSLCKVLSTEEGPIMDGFTTIKGSHTETSTIVAVIIKSCVERFGGIWVEELLQQIES